MNSRKKLRNREKKFKIEKNISELRKNFSIEKDIPESRKLFQNREKCFRIEKYFVTRIKKKSVELNVFITFLHNSFIVCVRLVTVKSCFAQNVALKLESFLFYMWA